MVINKASVKYYLRGMRHLFRPEVKTQIEGKPIVSPLRMGRGLNAYWRRSWKTEVIQRFCSTTNKPFIDIGANLGQTLFDHLLAESKTQYIGFEPNPECVYYLNSLIEKNSLTQYTIIPVGLAEQAKIVPLYSRKDNSGDDSATLLKELRPTWELASQYVPCFKFDEVRENLQLDQIGLMKIDVEGFELEVIKGMQETIETCKPVILCEVLFRDPHPNPTPHRKRNEELMQILANLNYDVLQIIKTPDDSSAVDTKKIEAFDTAPFSEENRFLCDYLFVPTEERNRVVDIILNRKIARV